MTHPRVEASTPVDHEANVVTHPRVEASAPVDHEANIMTHPRLDEVRKGSNEAPDADIPIDLHFIDRIFDDDTPTIEALAIESPGTPSAAGRSPEDCRADSDPGRR